MPDPATFRFDPDLSAPWPRARPPQPIELFRLRDATDELRGLAFQTSFGYAFGLELDTELVLLHLQRTVDSMIAYADRMESALIALGWHLILKDYEATGALGDVINLYGFLDDQVFLTKSGDLGIVLALEGVDYECLDADQREAVTRRFEVALRVLDESLRLSQYVLKRNHVAVPHTPVADPVVNTLLARRHQDLDAKGADLYALALYAVILAESGAQTAA